MQLINTLTILLAAAGTSLAAPAPTSSTTTTSIQIEERGSSTPLIDLWKNKSFLDLKFTGSGTLGTCFDLPSNFQNIASSGKARAGFRCTIWVKKNCQGTGFSFNEKPGSKSFPDWIDDKASSWKCVKDE
ncbi:hypothetical protein QBC47DRAFT_407097 [Echria macrotheca]|uniref:Uncharacterized protein n=1 Tax=Echria macrotheca TaxID=438768 RepID=A0AAJ0B5A9_9PEZI|nr:hypothetical protein QBC47DRAFT_407097 [Echria macrotheca]